MWEKRMVETSRGIFEFFVQGKGAPLCVAHLYSEFNELGNYFADSLVNDFEVYLINLKDAGASSVAVNDLELSMEETIKDLECIREALCFEKWGYAGHSTGGMLGLKYAILAPNSLTKLLVGGASASKEYMNHEESMYCSKSPLNKNLHEIFSVLKSSTSTLEERKKANMEWTNLSLYNIEKRKEYFAKPSSGKVVKRRLDYYSFTELPRYDVRESLLEVNVPSMVYCGRHDAQCPLVFSEEIYENLRNSSLYIFEKSNHYPFIEEKSEFKKMVHDFSEL
jgi:proline iminopeptidase